MPSTPRTRRFANDPLVPIDGAVVQVLLTKRGYGQRQLARAIHVHPSSINAVCQGTQKTYRATRVQALAKELRVSELVLQGRELPPSEAWDRWEGLVRSLDLDAPTTQALLLLPCTLTDMQRVFGLEPFGSAFPAGLEGGRKSERFSKAAVSAREQHVTAYYDVLWTWLRVSDRERVRRTLMHQRAAIAARFTLPRPAAKSPAEIIAGFQHERDARPNPLARDTVKELVAELVGEVGAKKARDLISREVGPKKARALLLEAGHARGPGAPPLRPALIQSVTKSRVSLPKTAGRS